MFSTILEYVYVLGIVIDVVINSTSGHRDHETYIYLFINILTSLVADDQ